MSIKISEHQVRNFGKISYVKIEPTGNVIALAGKNAAGKSTCLNSIQTNFAQFSSRDIPHPIKHGQAKAANETILSDGSILKRTFTPSGGAALVIKGPDGQKISQEKFKEKISSLGVDASKFPLLGAKEQLAALLSVVDLPFDPADLDAKRKAVYDERTAVNRDVKRLEAQASGFIAFPVDTPTEEINLNDLLTEHRAATQQNDAVQLAHANVKEWQGNVDQLRASLAHAEEMLATTTDYANRAPAIIDTAAIQQRIDNADQINTTVREYKSAQAVNAELTAARDTARQLDNDLEEIDKTKADGLAAAEMPVDGLSFDEEGVLYQGVPFILASTAEKIIVSVAMIIATNPEVRVALVRQGESLDADSLRIVHEMAEDNDFQLFIEIAANEAGDHDYYFVEGELAA